MLCFVFKFSFNIVSWASTAHYIPPTSLMGCMLGNMAPCRWAQQMVRGEKILPHMISPREGASNQHSVDHGADGVFRGTRFPNF